MSKTPRPRDEFTASWKVTAEITMPTAAKRSRAREKAESCALQYGHHDPR